ncbi:PDZ and LIM domain protein 7 isoform X2 [Labrus mixtus]|uniref:PDZ and LIM domain protein 7 isoform X2 n=2 Tax=Labrus mixtus TaxID=508554 RepID=UPI0029C07324|nr:PDZ and LIM domain protein 7 isoform X2 [Labrus mixtus]
MSGEQEVQEAMNAYTVTLSGPAPWGFRLQGGKDFSMPLTVSRLTPGGKAAQAGVGVGDWVVSIDDSNAEDMTHVEAQNKIRAATDSLSLTLSKAFKAVGDQKGPASMQQPQNGLEPTPSPAKAQAAHKPDGSNTAVAAVGRSGPSNRPPWVTDPGFADRFRPDKTSTVLTQHQQPVQPTPMQNRSSILQAAQQGPEDSGRTPLCGACNKIIRGRYLVALGRSWHPEEFTCSQCKAVLDEGGFFEERGSVYCTKCHDNRYAPNCAKCKKKITGEIMHALKMTYHVQCFKCAACKTAIRNQAFYMEEGEPYCEKDYEKMFGTKCHGCDFKIDAGDRFLEALGYSWHDTCFVCALCQINLEGKTFYSKKDKPLCKGHAFAPV